MFDSVLNMPRLPNTTFPKNKKVPLPENERSFFRENIRKLRADSLKGWVQKV